jgi:hypothetical protein
LPTERAMKEPAMHRLTAPALIALLMLAGASIAGAAPGSDTPAQPSAVDAAKADRDAYTAKAHESVRDWQKELHDFDVKAKADGKDADPQAKADLHVAWRKTQVAAGKLRIAGAKGWNAAKADFDTASRELGNAWRKIDPEHG